MAKNPLSASSNFQKSVISQHPTLQPTRTPPIFYLEGNIGAGKSTLAAALSETGKYTVIAEPVREWCDIGGYNFLALMCARRDLWTFPFQVLALTSLARRQRAALALGPANRPIILERSALSSLRVFSPDAVALGHLTAEHMALLRYVYDTLFPSVSRVSYIYVRTPPDTAMNRSTHRRRAEDSNLPRDYYHRLHRLLDHWMLQDEADPVYTVDGELSREEVFQLVELYLERATA